MRIICTGISGTGRLEWLRRVTGLARERGLGEVALYDVRESMFEVARDVGEPVEEETILDMFPRALVVLRAAALEKICSEIAAAEAAGGGGRPGAGAGERHWIINTHAVFRWKNTLISGFDPHYLTRLDPHLFATFTMGVKATQARLMAHPRWSGLTEEDVLTWREEEQFFTEEMARIHRKPQLLVPMRASVESGYRLLFEAGWKKAYLSYPMQHVDPGAERGLAAFRARLEERLVIFDPGDVNDFVNEDGAGEARPFGDGSPQLAALHDEEALSGVRRDRVQQHIADQIVARDYKLIQQSDMVVVYYDAAVPSPGVISEMKFALESGKQVYGVWLPGTEPSVFFTRYCSTWFRDEEGLFEYFARHGVTGGR